MKKQRRGLFDSVADYTEGKNKSLEILFHPGTMLTSELTAEIPTESAKEFYLSNGRGIEMNAVMQVQDIVRKRV